MSDDQGHSSMSDDQGRKRVAASSKVTFPWQEPLDLPDSFSTLMVGTMPLKGSHSVSDLASDPGTHVNDITACRERVAASSQLGPVRVGYPGGLAFGRGAVGGGGAGGSTQNHGLGIYFGSHWLSIPYKDNPYKSFKELVATPSFYWSDEEQCFVPVNPKRAVLPKADCQVAFSYHPGCSQYDHKDHLKICHLPTGDSVADITLHNVCADKKKNPYVRIPTNFAIPQEDLDTLGRIGPTFSPHGSVSSDVQDRASKEIKKHLPHLTSILTTKNYWSFGIAAYHGFGMFGLMKHIYSNRNRSAVSQAFPHGWWGIRGVEFVRLAHTYPPIHSQRATLSSQFYRTALGWMPKGFFIAVTKDGEPAERVRNVVIFEKGSPKVKYPFDEVIWLRVPKGLQ